MVPVCANWKGLELLLPLLCPPPKTMRPHQACPFGAGRGSQPAIRFPVFLKAGPPKNNLFWRNRAFFPVASRSNPRCSKAQIASYWAQIRRFLALAPQRMSHLFGKDRVFFGDTVNVLNFWISLKKPDYYNKLASLDHGSRIVLRITDSGDYRITSKSGSDYALLGLLPHLRIASLRIVFRRPWIWNIPDKCQRQHGENSRVLRELQFTTALFIPFSPLEILEMH